MTTTSGAILLLLGIEAAIIVIAAHRMTLPFRLRGLVIINMLMIALFGSALISLGGYITNITNICFVAAIAAQCVVLERHGPFEARLSIPMVIFALAAVFCITYGLGQFPPIPGYEADHLVIAALLHPSLKMLAASMAAFFLSQEVLIRCYLRLRPECPVWFTVMIASIAAQAVDTPAFFLIAFTDTVPPLQLSEMMAVGFLFKIALAVALLPAVLVAVQLPVGAGVSGDQISAGN